MSIDDLDTSKVEVKESSVEIKEPESVPSPPAQVELEKTALSDILGLTREETGKYHDKLDTLLEWAKTQTKDHSLENLKWVIRELGFKLGTPPLGQKVVNWLSEYAYLSMEGDRLNKKLEEYKHG